MYTFNILKSPTLFWNTKKLHIFQILSRPTVQCTIISVSLSWACQSLPSLEQVISHTAHFLLLLHRDFKVLIDDRNRQQKTCAGSEKIFFRKKHKNLFKFFLRVWLRQGWEPGMSECFNVLNNFCFHVYGTMLKSDIESLKSQTFMLILGHVFRLCFHVYAQKSPIPS